MNYLVGLGTGSYHVLALRRAFSARLLGAVAAAVVLVLAESAFLVDVYQPLMFYWVYYTV